MSATDRASEVDGLGVQPSQDFTEPLIIAFPGFRGNVGRKVHEDIHEGCLGSGHLSFSFHFFMPSGDDDTDGGFRLIFKAMLMAGNKAPVVQVIRRDIPQSFFSALALGNHPLNEEGRCHNALPPGPPSGPKLSKDLENLPPWPGRRPKNWASRGRKKLARISRKSPAPKTRDSRAKKARGNRKIKARMRWISGS